MLTIEFIQRFTERKTEHNKLRYPAVVVLEFGGGNCNKAGAASCRDFCAVPEGKLYNPLLDPAPDMLVDQFRKIALLKPAIVSIVPNGEAVITYQKSNTLWGEIFQQRENESLSKEQTLFLSDYYERKYGKAINNDQAMTPAEKTALVIALGENCGLRISLTTNGSFLNKDLLSLYRKMGLEYINLSYHPNKPFDPEMPDKTIQHLITKANEAIEADVVPTITHVLTRQNADTFVNLADYVAEHDILFAVGIANARGGGFSTSNSGIEPTEAQVKMVFRRLLARKLFADRHIRTTIPYLLMAPFLRNWICDQATDFFHLSIEKDQMQLRPKLNVCSEVRPDNFVGLENFIMQGKFDSAAYLKQRSEAMDNSEHGCPTCTHQCYFESETRGTLNMGKNIEVWDWWDSSGKALRQRYTFRHPIRPVVSKRVDFQNPYLWESLLQGTARIVAGLKDDNYWQETFKRSGVDYKNLLEDLIKDATSPEIIRDLVEEEKKSVAALSWHDSGSFQSRFFRAIYLPFQKSGREANIALPLKFRSILKHESPDDFMEAIEAIVKRKRLESIKPDASVLQLIKRAWDFLSILISNFILTGVTRQKLLDLGF
jgi:MoaA/NifB/PqqE/SkfB family radical SAM enzyme